MKFAGSRTSYETILEIAYRNQSIPELPGEKQPNDVGCQSSLKWKV